MRKNQNQKQKRINRKLVFYIREMNNITLLKDSIVIWNLPKVELKEEKVSRRLGSYEFFRCL